MGKSGSHDSSAITDLPIYPNILKELYITMSLFTKKRSVAEEPDLSTQFNDWCDQVILVMALLGDDEWSPPLWSQPQTEIHVGQGRANSHLSSSWP